MITSIYRRNSLEKKQNKDNNNDNKLRER